MYNVRWRARFTGNGRDAGNGSRTKNAYLRVTKYQHRRQHHRQRCECPKLAPKLVCRQHRAACRWLSGWSVFVCLSLSPSIYSALSLFIYIYTYISGLVGWVNPRAFHPVRTREHMRWVSAHVCDTQKLIYYLFNQTSDAAAASRPTHNHTRDTLWHFTDGTQFPFAPLRRHLQNRPTTATTQWGHNTLAFAAAVNTRNVRAQKI